MPNSLRCKLKKLKYQGLLTEKDCERLINALDNADKGWISIKDRLPDRDTWVMVYIEYPSPVLEMERCIQKTNSIKKIFYDGKSFYYDYGNITHWMPLPKPPKEDDSNEKS